MNELYVKNRKEWRAWLARNHAKSPGIRLVFYRKQTNIPSLGYDEAVEEALCFGWIDSIIKKRDHESYTRKFTPRKTKSRWSSLNKKRVWKLIRRGLMTEPGLAKVRAARESGQWEKPDRPVITPDVPEELKEALAENGKAKEFFDRLTPGYRKQYIGWISSARRKETRERRVRESIALLAQGKKLGMK